MKKIFLLILFFFIIIFSAYIITINNLDSKNLNFIKNNLGDYQKNIIKKYLLFNYNKNENKMNDDFDLRKLNHSQSRTIFEFEQNLRRVLNLFSYEEILKKEIYYIKNEKKFRFVKNTDLVIFEKSIPLTMYTSENGIYTGLGPKFPGAAFLDFYNENLLILSARGLLGYGNLNQEFNIFNVIENNINDFININQFSKKHWFSIKDLKIYKDKIFVSYSDEISIDCWNTSLIYGDINLTKIVFKKLYSSDSCIHSDVMLNKDEDFHGNQAGGRIFALDQNEVLLTIGDYRQRYLAQDLESTNGKIIKINLQSKKYEIISMGHRNPQGLFYNKDKDIIISTEHGPQGGDEVNIIKNNLNQIQNFGWPVSSYGEHYGGKDDINNKDLYKKYPLFKSHKDYGFIEPVINFTPSIAISEIVHISENKYAFSSLKEKSFYTFDLFENNPKNLTKYVIGERIRDMIIKNNQIFMFLENTASIAILDLENL